MAVVAGAGSIAGATWRDTARRPGFLLGALALGVLLALLPHLGNPAAGVGDNAALALELSLSTLWVAGPLVAGLLAVHLTQADHGAGLPADLLAAPLPPVSVLGGRWLGSAASAGAVGAIAAAVGCLGWIGASPPSTAGSLAQVPAVGLGWAAGVVLGGSLGCLYGAACPRDLARVLLVLHLVAGRWVASAAGASPWRHVFPDPSRLDLSREYAFGAPMSVPSALLGAGAVAIQAVAVLLVAALLLERRLVGGGA